jgi:hypothetical protein
VTRIRVSGEPSAERFMSASTQSARRHQSPNQSWSATLPREDSSLGTQGTIKKLLGMASLLVRLASSSDSPELGVFRSGDRLLHPERGRRTVAHLGLGVSHPFGYSADIGLGSSFVLTSDT